MGLKESCAIYAKSGGAVPDVSAGYKQTEIGLIPKNWKVLPFIGVVAAYIDYRGVTPRKLGLSWGGGTILALSANNVQMGRIDPDKEAYFGSDELYRRWMRQGDCERGDVLLTMEAPLGNVAQIPDGGKYILSQRVLLIRPREWLLSDFLAHYMRGSSFQSQLFQSSTGSTALGIQRKKLDELPIGFPDNKYEQQAIAEALSDADALIESLEQLIAKKRQIKQGTMQSLLTGKQRLPGFDGKWRRKALSELFDFSGGYSAPRDQLSADGHCYLHYGDIHTSSKSFVDVGAESQELPRLDISISKVNASSLLKDGDVVFVDASEDDEGTSKHVVIINKDNAPFISGLHTIVSKSKTEELDHAFRRYCFRTPDIKQQFRFFAVGTKVSGVSKSNIGKIEISFPPVAEQRAIATILTDMDAELTELETRLAKTRQLKQGMMQELLTGRIRLI